MTVTAKELNEKKKAPGVDGVPAIFHERWSPRSYSEREVSHEKLAKVFEAARWAASSSNEQPWKYVVGLKGSPTYQKIFESLMPANQKWVAKVPVLIIGTARKAFAKNNSPNRFALHDLGAADAHLVLEAAVLGLAAHQMGGFDEAKARQLLGIPEDYAVGSVIALGYQDDPEKLEDATLIERETAERTRKPLREIAFASWDESLRL